MCKALIALESHYSDLSITIYGISILSWAFLLNSQGHFYFIQNNMVTL